MSCKFLLNKWFIINLCISVYRLGKVEITGTPFYVVLLQIPFCSTITCASYTPHLPPPSCLEFNWELKHCLLVRLFFLFLFEPSKLFTGVDGSYPHQLTLSYIILHWHTIFKFFFATTNRLTGLSPFAGEDKQETCYNVSLASLDFPEEYFKNISHTAQDFIKRLLQRDAE